MLNGEATIFISYLYPAPYADSGPEEEAVPVDQVPGSVLSVVVWALVSLG
jgi:hypothetical protein